ncbi:Nas2-N domain-containing protein [Mycena kentingensis (nom. inval.)]|nr:Nas2-N domain-containing protein [Mycena kentingensis (nom. inval.)]
MATSSPDPAAIAEPQPTPAEAARVLMKRKDDIDAELRLHAQILSDQGVTLDSPLVDADGFPRGDIDIYRVREARKKIIELRNDRTTVMDALSLVLEQVFDPSTISPEPETPPQRGKPFAKVDGLSPGSPAAEAGLLHGDLIVQFASLTQHSFSSSSLSPLVEVVSQHENRAIPLKVQRNGQTVVLSLVPKRWPGRGLLGCHIVPYSPP